MKIAKIALASSVALFSLALPEVATAQIRVDARIHTSSGSCSSCDLSKRRMTGLKLQDSDFSRSLFNNSNLSGARFDRSNLSEAHFHKALLLRVEGENVNLSGASLQDATLTEAELSNSNLSETDFRRADLTRSTFKKTNFNSANLSSASATLANFSGSNFSDARLDHINLTGANLQDGVFHKTLFGNAALLDANLKGADFSAANLSQAQGLSQSQLDMACGDSETQLPTGLSLKYCKDSKVKSKHNHKSDGHMDPDVQQAARELDEAINNIELLLNSGQMGNASFRRKLQGIHADMVASRRALER